MIMSKIASKQNEIKQTITTFRGVFHYIGGYWKDTWLTWGFVLGETIFEALVAYFMQFIIDSIKTGDITKVYIYCAVVATCAISAAILGILSGYWAASASSGFGKNLRAAMYSHIQDYSFKDIDKFSSSSIVTRTTTDVTNVQNGFQQAIRAVIRAPFLMVISLILCFVTEWRLAWIFLVIIPLVLWGLIYVAGKVHPTFVKVFNTYDDLNQNVEENVDGIRVVKAFDREDLEKKKFGKTSDYICQNFTYAEKLLAFNSPIMNISIDACFILISYFGAILVTQSNETELTRGGLTTLFTYVQMIFNSLMMISMVYVMITIARNSAERINEILMEVPDIVSPDNAIKEVKDGSIKFHDVSFAYADNKDVLTDINLDVPSGSTLGIIGSTGSSKSTLISLLARLYDASKGEVLVGNEDVKKYDLTSLRDSVAVVLQKNTLFTGTIRSNLLWGNPNASDEEIWKACDIAQCTSFIKSFPRGLDTPIDEGGNNVSGGQKQRLCIARALLKNPKVLILDDSTSACDTHTDALIRDGLKNSRHDVTKLVIAQRVLSIKDCEQIVVMDKGKIIAQGDNDSLLKNCPIYKSLYDSQLGGGGDFDASH
jgi:ATP-binding cassette subfamily B multidrug efflux pump